MPELTTSELARVAPGSFDTESLDFCGPRGNPRRHLSQAELEARLTALPPAPRDTGSVVLMVARGPNGERVLPESALLTQSGGMPGDRWEQQTKYGPSFQLATTRADFARIIANGQALELHGDNLYLDLDLSAENLPSGSRLKLGAALVEVTPQAHDGCKKWVQRFGLDALQLNLAPGYRNLHVRGIYLVVIEDGIVRRGDAAVVSSRGSVPAT